MLDKHSNINFCLWKAMLTLVSQEIKRTWRKDEQINSSMQLSVVLIKLYVNNCVIFMRYRRVHNSQLIVSPKININNRANWLSCILNMSCISLLGFISSLDGRIPHFLSLDILFFLHAIIECFVLNYFPQNLILQSRDGEYLFLSRAIWIFITLFTSHKKLST